MKVGKIWDRNTRSEYMYDRIKFMNRVTGGTANMRKVATEEGYLPKFPKETDAEYQVRLKTSVLHDSTSNAIEGAKGKIFSKEPNFVNYPSEFELYNIINNFDNDGTDINKFASELCGYQVRDGLAFVFVAYPSGANDSQSNNRIFRPYARIVSGDKLINERYESVNGQRVLTQIVIEEHDTINVGDFGQATVEQYRLIRLINGQMQYAVIRKTSQGGEETIESGVIRILGQQSNPRIPFVPCYGEKKGFLIGRSPFEELGRLNISHYQKKSDFDATLHLSGSNTPLVTGEFANNIPNKDGNSTQAGGSEIMHLTADSDFKFVSGGGNLEMMHDDLKELEDDMKSRSFDVIDTGEKTATQINDEKNNKHAKINSLADNLDDTMNKVLILMCEYMNISPNEYKEMLFSVNRDYNLTVMPIEELAQYAAMQINGQMTMKALYNEAQKGERLLTVEEIDQEIELLNDGLEGVE